MYISHVGMRLYIHTLLKRPYFLLNWFSYQQPSYQSIRVFSCYYIAFWNRYRLFVDEMISIFRTLNPRFQQLCNEIHHHD